MPDFSKRSYEKELLDRDNIPFEDIRRNMQELEFINRYLGGHRITKQGINSLIAGWERLNSPGDKPVVCEIGCGGGDNLKVIHEWCSSRDLETKLIGIDINKECIEYARENCKNLDADWIASDYRDVVFDAKPDIIFSSLFCHHFDDEGVIEIIEWLKKNSGAGFFISDLHRHPLAYYSIKCLAKLFSRSYLVKNDAPLSVRRGFKKKELEILTKRASLINAHIKWRWAFRWLIIANHDRE
jgi:2-polyprenyl-3-methyl-5-hydroxy-6-metoxy-1,4-benzoquinol methylase